MFFLSSRNSLYTAQFLVLSNTGLLMACSPIRFEADPAAAGQTASAGAGTSQGGSGIAGGVSTTPGTTASGAGGVPANSSTVVAGAGGVSTTPGTTASGAGGVPANSGTVVAGTGGASTNPEPIASGAGGVPANSGMVVAGAGGVPANSGMVVAGAGGVSTTPGTTASGAGGVPANSGTVAAGGGGGAPPSAVNQLHFTREGAMGFCIEDGAAMDLKLARMSNGLMSVEGFSARVTPNTGAQCDGQSYEENCVVPMSFASFTLSATQQRQLDELLLALPNGICETSTLCDPCLVPTLEFDGRSETSLCCGEQKAPGFNDRFQEILDFLDALIPRSTTFETFKLERRHGMGFCAKVGQAQSAVFTRGPDGALTVSGSRVESLLTGTNSSCPKGTYKLWETAACVSDIPTQRLSVEQQSELEQLIAALPAGQCEEDPLRLCDPCILSSMQIDLRKESGDCCSGQQRAVGFDQAYDAIEAYVDSLFK